MLRCPRCEKVFEDDDETAVCDACGVELLRAGPEPPVAAVGFSELVTVYEPADLEDLDRVRGLLAAADIQFYVPRMTFTAPRVQVPAELAERAKAVIAEGGRPSPLDEKALAALWSKEVAPVLAGAPARSLASSLAVAEALRQAVLAALGRAGARGVEVIEELGLAFVLQGPRAAAVEAAAHLAASDAARERRERFLAALGGLVAYGAERDVLERAVLVAERFRGVAAAERAMVPLLEHADAAVRDAAIEALYTISGGETLGFEPDAPPEERAAAVGRWWARLGGRP
jgi:hypothetical protein